MNRRGAKSFTQLDFGIEYRFLIGQETGNHEDLQVRLHERHRLPPLQFFAHLTLRHSRCKDLNRQKLFRLAPNRELCLANDPPMSLRWIAFLLRTRSRVNPDETPGLEPLKAHPTGRRKNVRSCFESKAGPRDLLPWIKTALSPAYSNRSYTRKASGVAFPSRHIPRDCSYHFPSWILYIE